MNDNFYKILGANPSDTDEELRQKYQSLRAKYLEERFCDGDKGNKAAQKLTDIETAYNEIMSVRNQSKETQNGLFTEVDNALKNNDLRLAQEKLDLFDERNGEWHYYQSVVFYKKNWINESKKQLEIALQIDPNNQKYKNSLEKLEQKVSNGNQNANNNGNTFKSGSNTGAYGNVNNGYGEETPQLGGNSCLQWCCDMLICNAILNCCCSCR